MATRIGARDWTGDDTRLTQLDGSLYALQGGLLWKIDDVTTGQHHRIGAQSWPGATSIVGGMWGTGPTLWIVKGDRLHFINPNNLSYNYSSAVWGGPTSMTQIAGVPYIAQGGAIWRVETRYPITWSRVGTDGWPEVKGMAALEGALLITNGRYLTRLDLGTETAELLQNGDWGGRIVP